MKGIISYNTRCPVLLFERGVGEGLCKQQLVPPLRTPCDLHMIVVIGIGQATKVKYFIRPSSAASVIGTIYAHGFLINLQPLSPLAMQCDRFLRRIYQLTAVPPCYTSQAFGNDGVD